jgi:hypothetical protein
VSSRQAEWIMIHSLLRRLRGALGNAVIWASTFFLAAFPVVAAFWVITAGSFPLWSAAVGAAKLYGGMGFLAGGAFSLYLRIAGRNRRLSELRPSWVAWGTGITVCLLAPPLGIYGLGAPVSLAIQVGLITGVLAGFTAMAQVKIAQKALAPGEDSHDELEPGREGLLPGPETETE